MRPSRFLHDHSHFAVAQSKYVFIYDRDGVELHRLKSHVEPTLLEFLPYHWLLVSVVSYTPVRILQALTPTWRKGPNGIFEIPGYLNRANLDRAPHEVGGMHHHDPKYAQCCDTPWSSERYGDLMDAKFTPPGRAAVGTSRSSRQYLC